MDTQPPSSLPPVAPAILGKQRHGCLTAYLIFAIVVNIIVLLLNLIQSNSIVETYGTSMIMVGFPMLLGIVNIISAFLLWHWKKLGFYLFCISAVLACLVNLIFGLNLILAVSGLVGIAILYFVLQIGNQQNKGWPQLE